MCKDLHIDFPEVPNDLEDERDDPKDFYVFEGPNAPTVIHIPLFNKSNCGDKGNVQLLLCDCWNVQIVLIIIIIMIYIFNNV